MNEPKVNFAGEDLTLDQVEEKLKQKYEHYNILAQGIGMFVIDIVSYLKNLQLLTEDIDKLINYRDALRYEKERQNEIFDKKINKINQ